MDFLPVGWSGFSSGAGNRNGEAGLDAGWQMGLQTQPFVFLDAGKEEDDLGYQMEKHDEQMDEHKSAIEWEKLTAAQKEAWKAKLKKAGHWGEEVADDGSGTCTSRGDCSQDTGAEGGCRIDSGREDSSGDTGADVGNSGSVEGGARVSFSIASRILSYLRF